MTHVPERRSVHVVVDQFWRSAIEVDDHVLVTVVAQNDAEDDRIGRAAGGGEREGDRNDVQVGQRFKHLDLGSAHVFDQCLEVEVRVGQPRDDPSVDPAGVAGQAVHRPSTGGNGYVAQCGACRGVFGVGVGHQSVMIQCHPSSRGLVSSRGFLAVRCGPIGPQPVEDGLVEVGRQVRPGS